MKPLNEFLEISLEEFIKRQEAVEKWEKERTEAIIRLSQLYSTKWNKRKK